MYSMVLKDCYLGLDSAAVGPRFHWRTSLRDMSSQYVFSFLVDADQAVYSLAFHAARSADSNGRSRPSQNIGHSWNHFSRLQME